MELVYWKIMMMVMIIYTGLLIVMSSCDFVIFGEQFNTFKDRKNES